MRMKFYKYQGAGNDFVLVDDRAGTFPSADTELVRAMCDRRRGVGADGLILLQNDPQYDFRMVYYNSDGRESTMCGNGGRCIAAFAGALGLGRAGNMVFRAVDGRHEAKVADREICLGMKEIDSVSDEGTYCFLDTGSPHYVTFVDDVRAVDVRSRGRAIRQDGRFAAMGGTNVNFAEVKDGKIFLRTYERGVEDETLACGTGAVAVAVAAHFTGRVSGEEVCLAALGGPLRVSFRAGQDGRYTHVRLTGGAEKVFDGVFYYGKE